MDGSADQPLLQVALDPYTAAWVNAQLSPESWEKACERTARNGRPDLARAMRLDQARLREAGRQWGERFQADRVSCPTGRTSDVVVAESAGPSVQEMSTAETMEVLGVSARTIRRWCLDGTLVARQPHSRSWWVARESVMDLLEVRRAS
jgi:hypothetical protein